MIFGNKSFSAPFLTQWVGDDLQNVSAFYGGPSNELNWTFMNERLTNSLWQSDDGSTKTLDVWENGYVVSTNPDGTLTAKPKYTSGLPSLTLTRVQTMSSEGADTNTPTEDTSTEGEEEIEEEEIAGGTSPGYLSVVDPQESTPLFCWTCPAGYIIGGVATFAVLMSVGWLAFAFTNNEAYVATTAMTTGAGLLRSLND